LNYGGAANHDQKEGWQNAKGAPREKVKKAEPVRADIFNDLIDDKIARYHEEDVDTDIAAGSSGNIEVRAHNHQNCEGAEPIDERPIGADTAEFLSRLLN
jgi:hypothetical protein